MSWVKGEREREQVMMRTADRKKKNKKKKMRLQSGKRRHRMPLFLLMSQPVLSEKVFPPLFSLTRHFVPSFSILLLQERMNESLTRSTIQSPNCVVHETQS